MNLVDQIICEVDKGIKFSLHNYQKENRRYPAHGINEDNLSEIERSHSANLMRVNHSGEVAAQGLYRGQAMTAKLEGTREKMDHAAQEELDHLSWCNKRLQELNEHPSLLNPAWYALSFGMGAAAGLAGDKWSLGFVHETEEQVVRHLEGHLDDLSLNDKKTAAILEQMQVDESKHSEEALESGAENLPEGLKSVMSVIAKVMTKTSYYI
ncbi:2-polyprenyl-3-methyl-6-methoxy-1,4-benzoquinone monooxygenase [Gammaproteobacteria bacterium]|nr:2-polyprenyl-3-methyl-6-methoxy-1,4-benzoquinone monooxygenase [Gammaproteobacteria bacterium]MDB3994802.1 2-polyprenyl-3-methyl-6-methoxy-1,4-benzoquinone monooxygenase [Gammaproteobacteria bacterium]MDC0509391.1 2-polyprenyl-3-methyl-6-methoxy-1,4-benzoquinone monooxygenase [Gammaproteobacteria bacterium]MDC0569764.1 2-polyprenyl-3-methyl-6-methoxy-1,4-benzoquinone monooxygenase [Gammaproteobacteria bacterium]MDC1251757.1 2-polyprenyl-3-methyl-6-methoxy-1,4-benzoquinone monooxygenase [Gamm|tara:strand:- start:86 stop:715 length:630 start_codon:yes stop_codon:yes gene_type:complete